MSDYYKGQRRFALGGIKGSAAADAVQKHPQAGKVCCCMLFLLPEVRCLTLVHTGGAIDGLLIVWCNLASLPCLILKHQSANVRDFKLQVICIRWPKYDPKLLALPSNSVLASAKVKAGQSCWAAWCRWATSGTVRTGLVVTMKEWVTHSDSLVKCRPFCTCAQGTSRIGAALVITNLRNMQLLPLCHKYRRKNVCILYVQSLELSCKRWPKHVRCTWIEVWKLHELRTLWLLPQKPKTVFTSTTWNFSWRA